MPSCIAASPEGFVRYWPSIAHEGSYFEVSTELQVSLLSLYDYLKSFSLCFHTNFTFIILKRAYISVKVNLYNWQFNNHETGYVAFFVGEQQVQHKCFPVTFQLPVDKGVWYTETSYWHIPHLEFMWSSGTVICILDDTCDRALYFQQLHSILITFLLTVPT